MLDNILYIDHAILKTSYEEGEFKPKTGGTFTYTVTRHDNVAIANAEEEKDLHFIDSVDILVKAENVDESAAGNTKAFTLTSTFEVIYKAPEEIRSNLDSDFFNENAWFFSNYAYQIAHNLTLSILKQTKFRGVISLIPRHRTD